MITLYGDRRWESPWFLTAFVALREKDLPFETMTLDLQRGDQRSTSFASAITSRIPAIEHQGFWLAESTAIVEYIDESFEGRRLLPRDTQQRARARQLLSWLRTDLIALREERPTTTMFFTPSAEPLSSAAQASADKLIAVSENLLGDRQQLFDQWSIADVDLAVTLQRLIINGHKVPETLAAFAAREWARPSVRAFVERDRVL